MYPPPPLSVISSLLGVLAWTTSFLPFHQACGSGLALLLTQSSFIMVSITLLFTYFNWEQSILRTPHLPLASLHYLSKQWPYWLKTPFSDKDYQTPLDLHCSFTVSPFRDVHIAEQVLSIFRKEWAWSTSNVTMAFPKARVIPGMVWTDPSAEDQFLFACWNSKNWVIALQVLYAGMTWSFALTAHPF